jgi:hypothetical protein
LRNCISQASLAGVMHSAVMPFIITKRLEQPEIKMAGQIEWRMNSKQVGINQDITFFSEVVCSCDGMSMLNVNVYSH